MQAIRLEQPAPEEVRLARVVGRVLLIGLEWDRVDDLLRLRRDADLDAEGAKPLHEVAVEGRHRCWLELHGEGGAIAVLHP